jgi:hypothetical protein
LAKGSLFEFLARRLGDVATEEVVGGIFSEERGRGSTPPEHLVALLLLRYFEGVSYEVASDRARYDLRWKAVLGVPASQLGPVVSDTTLNDFEKALRERGRFEKLVGRTVALAKEAGLLGDEVEAAQDSSPVVGRGAVQDTYNLLGTSIRKLVRAIAKEQHEPARAVAHRHGVEDLFVRSTKATAEIDWSDREAKRRFLQRLVETAKRLVEQVDPREPWGVAQTVVEAVAIIRKVLAQDIEVATDGRVSLRQGVAEDRLISVHDPEMRRGHKTQSEAFEGHKFHITIEVEHGFVLATEVTGANVHDSEPSARMAERAEEASGSVLTKVIGDCAYGTEKNRVEHANVGRLLVAKIPKAAHGALLGKEHFEIDLKHKTVTCPAGVCTSTSEVVRARNAEPHKERLAAEERSRLFVFPPGRVCELSPARRMRLAQADVEDRRGRAARGPLHRRSSLRQDRTLSGRPQKAPRGRAPDRAHGVARRPICSLLRPGEGPRPGGPHRRRDQSHTARRHPRSAHLVDRIAAAFTRPSRSLGPRVTCEAASCPKSRAATPARA